MPPAQMIAVGRSVGQKGGNSGPAQGPDNPQRSDPGAYHQGRGRLLISRVSKTGVSRNQGLNLHVFDKEWSISLNPSRIRKPIRRSFEQGISTGHQDATPGNAATETRRAVRPDPAGEARGPSDFWKGRSSGKESGDPPW